MPHIHKAGVYLNRVGHTVGIVQDRGAGQAFRWLTTRGHYVTADGAAGIGVQTREDLVVDVTPSADAVAAMDEMGGM